MVEVDKPHRFGGLVLEEGTPDILGDVINNESLSREYESKIRFVDRRGVTQEISSKWLDPNEERYTMLQNRIKDKYGNRSVSQNTIFNEAFDMESNNEPDDWL